MKQPIWHAAQDRSRIRKYSISILGVAIAVALITGAVGLYFVNVAATGPSASDSRVQAWVGQLDSEELTPARHLAQQHLEEAGGAAVDPLVSALHSPDSTLRRNSAEMLGFIGSPRSVNALAAALANDPVASVRSRAAWALGESNDLQAVSPLETASVRDQDARVRQEALGSLDALRSHLAMLAGKNDKNAGAFAIAPSQPSTVYLAVLNQISVSRDGGKTWIPVGGKLPSRVSSMVVSPANPNLIFAGTESLGLYETTDGGTTWRERNQGLGLGPGVRLSVTAVTIDPQQPDRVYVARGVWIGGEEASLSPLGVMVSQDRGASWAQANLPPGNRPISRLVIFGNELYVASGDAVTSIPL